MSSLNERDAHSVAITGLSCRFPGDGDNIEHFWDSICQGKSAWSEIPKERFNVDAFYSASKNHNTSVTRGAHFLKQNVKEFDANFFGFSKVEADSMDPQHRLMIEVTYEALEKAGLSLDDIAGTQTGVFMGHFTSDYREMIFRDPEAAPPYTASGASKTSLANRISWLFDLQGPSFSLDTACSSSLVALHLACQSLRTGESDIAIVGGVNLLLNPEMFMYFSNQHFLSPDGKCKSFDESANGYGRGEGFAAVILKRVDDAISNGDPLRAIIRGSGSNQDGHTKGFTLPSAESQAALIKETYQRAGLDYRDTNYVEAHGTGTQAGDTKETEALSNTISKERSSENKLLVGSVKSNIGHLEACAGLAAVVKSVLILESGMIPPTIHYRKGNPKIPFEEWNIEIPITLTPWPTEGLRRISTNSFGYGGTNAHAVLDDAYHYLKRRGIQGIHYTKFSERPVYRRQGHSNVLSDGLSYSLSNRLTNGSTNGNLNSLTNGYLHGPAHGYSNGHSNNLTNGSGGVNCSETQPRPRLYVFSAQDKEGLKRVKFPFGDFLKAKSAELDDDSEEAQAYQANLAYTLSKRRSHLQWRTFGIASSLDHLSQILGTPESDAVVHRATKQPRIGFVFTGQGAQWPKMGCELMSYPCFRECIEAADHYLRANCGCLWSAKEELEKGKSTSQLHLASHSQTLCTVLQVAIVDLMKTWNITPVAVAGHSSGEIGAAYCLGALSREDAWKIAYYRGLLSSRMKTTAPELEGSMMAVGTSSKQAEVYFSQVRKGEVVVACVNSPSSVTVSGDTAGINELLDILKAEGVFARKLQVDTAYHSPHMQLVAQDYLEAIADIEPKSYSGSCKMHSSVTGSLIESGELGAINWVRNLTSPVQFAAAIHDMMRPFEGGKRSENNAVDILIEIGPHSALQGPAIQTLKALGVNNIPYYSVVRRNEDAVQTALGLAGTLFTHGSHVDVPTVNIDRNSKLRPLVDLPMYPWSHSQNYWTESRLAKEYRLRKQPCLSLLGAPFPTLAQGEHLWRKFIKLSEEPWISDHQIETSILYPGAGFLAMAFEAAYQIADANQQVAAFRLRDVQLSAAAIISEDSDLECIVQLRPHIAGTRDNASTWTEFTVTTSPDGQSLQRCCSGLLVIEYEPKEDSDTGRENELESNLLKNQYLEAAHLCKNHITPMEFYKDLNAMGLIYGPTFANLTAICNTDGTSFCAVDIPDTSMNIIKGLQDRPHIIHPGTLDAIFHMAFAAANGGKQKLEQPMVPRAIDEVVVSAYIPYKPGTRLSGFSNAKRHGFKDLQADIIVLDEQAARPLVKIAGFTCTQVGGSSAISSDESAAKKICSKLTWEPAIKLLSSKEKKHVIEARKSCVITDALKHKIANSETAEHLLLETEGVKSISEKISEYLRFLHYANPELSVLELNTGSGDITSPLILPMMDNLEAILATAEYTISCHDGDAMIGAQERLSSYGEEVKYAVFDIDQHTETQELGDRKFDVIITVNLSNAVKHPDLALSNARKLLKEGGEVLLVEITKSGSFATLESQFTRNGFQSPTIFQDSEDLKLQQVCLFAAGIESGAEVTKAGEEVVLLEAANPSETTRAVTAKLVNVLNELSYKTTPFAWGSDVSTLKNKSCIALTELESSLISTMSEQDFASLKQLISEAASTLWLVGLDDPSGEMISGLARVVRNETPGLSFRTLHTNSISLNSPENLAELVSRVFMSNTSDDEFRIRDGIISISRIEEDAPLNEQIERLLPHTDKKIDMMPLSQAPGPYKLCVQTPGMLDSLCFEPDDLPCTDLEHDEIEIQVKATALNFREVMSVMGQIPDKLLGFDASGIVRRVGSAVTKFKVNDKVAMYGHGSHRTVHRSKADFCMLIPDGLSFEQAATIPVVHGTAWYGLVRLAHVRKGQSILIHAAAGGVGQAAIQIAKHFEMDIYATVGSEVKRKLLRETYDIPDDHIFNSRDLSFVQGIKRMTAGRGVDVILNSLSGEALRQTWYCIAPFGVFLEIGIKDILNNTELDMRPFLQDATFAFFNLNHIEKARPDIMASIIEGAFDFQRRGISRPITPMIVYPISEVENAFRLMQTGKHIGKIALTFGEHDVVPLLNAGADPFHVNENAAYLLVGGLGGLGRSISTMLVDHGARKLCFLSRSGGTSAEAQKLLQDLRARQVQVQAYACDIADEAATAKAITRCSEELGPVRGVIQCAMLLRDVLYSNMTYQEWTESIRPKVQGTWNLHNHLKNVDFFVVLSSFAGTFGNRGQSNYAAGCAYQDAIARYRRSLGLHAVTLDLGLMRDVGVLAEKGITGNLAEWEEPYGIRENEFHALLKRAISGDMAGDIPPQVLTGLATGGSAMAAGISTPFYLEDARFTIMAKTGVRAQSAKQKNSTSVSTQTLIAQATSLQEATEHITDALVNRVAKMLQTPTSEIDTARFLHSYGIDSLVAIEIVNWALKELKATLTVIDVMAGVPMTTTAKKIASSSALCKGLT